MAERVLRLSAPGMSLTPKGLLKNKFEESAPGFGSEGVPSESALGGAGRRAKLRARKEKCFTPKKKISLRMRRWRRNGSH